LLLRNQSTSRFDVLARLGVAERCGHHVELHHHLPRLLGGQRRAPAGRLELLRRCDHAFQGRQHLGRRGVALGRVGYHVRRAQRRPHLHRRLLNLHHDRARVDARARGGGRGAGRRRLSGQQQRGRAEHRQPEDDGDDAAGKC
jgi:hypothetical protein